MCGISCSSIKKINRDRYLFIVGNGAVSVAAAPLSFYQPNASAASSFDVWSSSSLSEVNKSRLDPLLHMASSSAVHQAKLERIFVLLNYLGLSHEPPRKLNASWLREISDMLSRFLFITDAAGFFIW